MDNNEIVFISIALAAGAISNSINTDADAADATTTSTIATQEGKLITLTDQICVQESDF